MRSLRFLIPAAVILVVLGSWAAEQVTETIGFAENGNIGWVGGHELRFPHDPADLLRYHELGQWALGQGVPAKDYLIEYPPLAVALFGGIRALFPDARPFAAAFTMLATAAGVGLLITVHTLLQKLGRSPAWILLLALPATAFSILNRFDVFVALSITLSLLALLTRRPIVAGILLGLGIGLKVVPFLLVPLYLASLPQERWRWKFLAAVTATTIVSYLAFFPFWGSTVLEGIRLQLERLPTQGTLLGHLVLGTNGTILVPALRYLFIALQLLFPFLVFFELFPREERARAALTVRWAALTLTIPVLLSAFFSPQFLLWCLPVLILCDIRPVPLWLLLLIGLDAATFIQFPLLFDTLKDVTWVYHLSSIVRSAVYGAVVILLVRSLRTYRRA